MFWNSFCNLFTSECSWKGTERVLLARTESKQPFKDVYGEFSCAEMMLESAETKEGNVDKFLSTD